MASTVVQIPDTARVLTGADDGNILVFTSDSAVTVSCPGTLTEGMEIVCVQAGDGQITFTEIGGGNFLNSGVPVTRSKRSYVAITLESDGNYAFNGALGSDKVLVKTNFAAIASPTVSNDDSEGYSAGSLWIYSNSTWICTDASTGAANWVSLGDLFADGSVALTGDLDAGGNTISNLSAPTSDQEAATKKYVDENAATGAGDIKSDGTVAFAADQSMGGFKITNLATPTADTDSATKAYVDAQSGSGGSGFVLADGSVAFTGDQSMGSNKITNLTDPTSAQDAATKAYVDSNSINAILANGSISMAANFAMGNNRITGLSDPSDTQDAATKAYVDGNPLNTILANGSVPMAANFAMGNNRITGLGTPTNGTDATTKAYVDSLAVTNAVLRDGSTTFLADTSMGGFRLINMADPSDTQDAATKGYVDSLSGGGSSAAPHTFKMLFQTTSSNSDQSLTNSSQTLDRSWDSTLSSFPVTSSVLQPRLEALVTDINNKGQKKTVLTFQITTASGGPNVRITYEYIIDWENGVGYGSGVLKDLDGSGTSNYTTLVGDRDTWTTTSTSTVSLQAWNWVTNSSSWLVGDGAAGIAASSIYIVPSTRSITTSGQATTTCELPGYTRWNGSSKTQYSSIYDYTVTNYF